MARGTRISDADLGGIIASELAQADGANSDALDAVRQLATAYYYGDPRTSDAVLAEAGRSTLRTSDVADMVEAVVAQMAPMLADPNLASFDPIGEDDEEQAELESAMVADQLWQENDGFLELQQAVKDGLLMRTAWLKVWIDTDETVATEELKQVDDATLQAALVDRKPNELVELVDVEQVAVGEYETPLYDARVKRTMTHRKLRVEARRAEDMAYAGDWQRPVLEGCRFIAERAELERAELLDMGVSEKVVEELQPYTARTSGGDQARSTTQTPQLGGHEWSTELVEVEICHIRIDLDSNGAPSLYRVLYADGRVLHKEERAFVPYVNGWALLRPFRMDGVSLFDKLRAVEDAKTKALRTWADNLENTNNQRLGVVENQVRISELIRRTPAGYVTIKQPDAIQPIPSQDLGPSAQLFMDYQDRRRSEAGGASLDLQSAEAQIAGHTAAGTERQYTARELLASLMARNIAETLVRGTYRLIHRTMRTASMGELQLKRAGEWQRSDPRTWKERSRLSVNLGLTPAERERTKASLREVIGLQTSAMQAGYEGVLVTLEGMHAAAVELAQASGLPAPERYYVNPASPEARQALEQRSQQAQAEQAELQETRAALLRLTLAHERYQHDTELRFKYFETLLDNETTRETKEAELVGSAAVQLAKASAPRDGGNGQAPA